MSVTADEQDGTSAQDPAIESSEVAATSSKPSRRVRTAPGGATSDIFGLEGTDDDALSLAPPIQKVKLGVPVLCMSAYNFLHSYLSARTRLFQKRRLKLLKLKQSPLTNSLYPATSDQAGT